MGRLAQVGWNKTVEDRLAAAEKLIADLLKRIEALEQKRGPGRPKNDDRNPAGSN